MNTKIAPIHPGEILVEEFLKPMGVKPESLAECIGVPVGCVDEIVQGRVVISEDVALRLSRYFGMSERFWMNLQARYDREVGTL